MSSEIFVRRYTATVHRHEDTAVCDGCGGYGIH
jgi:hypothetical protein